MRVCNSRKSTHSVMNHGGFGALKIIVQGVEVIIPEQLLTSTGALKKCAYKYVEKQIEKAKLLTGEVNNAC